MVISKVDNYKRTYNKGTGERLNAGQQGDTFSMQQNLKAEYDMWTWIYVEISNLRMEVSRLSSMVRINTSTSPAYLELYHAHLYSLLISFSPVLKDTHWIVIETLWLDAKKDIDTYFSRRNGIPNLKIPFELICKLDKLYRIALLVAQRANLGIRISRDPSDMDAAIENAITGKV